MRTRTSIALAAALAVAAPAAADAQQMPKMPKHNFGIKTAKFLVSVDAKQVTTWKEPRWKGNFDCQGQRWHEGGGTETVKARTAKPVKTTVTKAGPSALMVRYAGGNKRRNFFMDTPAKVTRTGRIVNTIDPDWCFGGGPTTSDTGPYDCRTLNKPNMQANLIWRGSRMSVEFLDQDGIFPEEAYKNCPIIIPHGVDESSITTISQRYPPREVFDRSEGLVEVLGRKTFKYKDVFRTGTTRVTWKVRLRRLR